MTKLSTNYLKLAPMFNENDGLNADSSYSAALKKHQRSNITCGTASGIKEDLWENNKD